MRNYVSPVLDRPLYSACPHTRHQSSHLILGERESLSNSDEVHDTGSWAAGAGGYFQAVVPVQSPVVSLLFLPAHISELHCNEPRGSMRAESNSWAAADRYNFIGKIKSLQKSTLTIWHSLSALRSLNYLECYFQFWEPNDRRGASSTELWVVILMSVCAVSAHQPFLTTGSGTQSAHCLQTRGSGSSCAGCGGEKKITLQLPGISVFAVIWNLSPLPAHNISVMYLPLVANTHTIVSTHFAFQVGGCGLRFSRPNRKWYTFYTI